MSGPGWSMSVRIRIKIYFVCVNIISTQLKALTNVEASYLTLVAGRVARESELLCYLQCNFFTIVICYPRKIKY